MAARKNKRTRAPRLAAAEAPAALNLAGLDRRRYTWSFGAFDWESPFGAPSPEEALGLMQFLASVEHLSVREMQAGGHHEIATRRLSRPAQERLAALNLTAIRPQISALWSFRVSRSSRLWCIRRGDKHFALLWWDPRHQVYRPR